MDAPAKSEKYPRHIRRLALVIMFLPFIFWVGFVSLREAVRGFGIEWRCSWKEIMEWWK